MPIYRAFISGTIVALYIFEMSTTPKKTKGFTLIELMLVVVIIGLLAALAIPRFARAASKSKVSEAKSVLKQLYMASQAYIEENGEPPAAIEDVFGAGFESRPSGFIVKVPSGTPRFLYDLDGAGGAVAKPNLTLDGSLTGLSNLIIDSNGNLTGGEF
jgi:prepilin-type N-terminal cleavage/methylation domain-containing protein